MEIYRARWIVPIESSPIEDGCIAVEAGVIKYVGPYDAGRLRNFQTSTVHDLGDQILLPGFVNAHTHLELTCYDGKISRGPLWPWLGKVVELCRAPDAKAMQLDAVRAGANESLAAGVTCVADISRTGANVEVLKQFPLRKVCYLELISRARLPPNDANSLVEVYEGFKPFADGDRLRLGVSPHAPYSVTMKDLVDVADWVLSHRVPLTMHLMESTEEAAWLAGDSDAIPPEIRRSDWIGRANSTFIAWLGQSSFAEIHPLFAHVNYATDDDLNRLSIMKANVVYCPRAHEFFGHSPHRWQEMLAAGINVCVGTDSKASNDSLSILDELRFLQRRASQFSPATLFEMGTLRGAKAIGFADVIGSLVPGKRADFITIPLDRNGSNDPVINILDSNEISSGVWIDGISVLPIHRPAI